jgi:hypothetical protein
MEPCTLTYGTRYGTGGSNTSSGTCTSGSTSEAWANGATGKFNSSLDFDGTDDYVLIADNNFGTSEQTRISLSQRGSRQHRL